MPTSSGATTYHVKKDQVKFSFIIEDWQFTNEKSRLEANLAIQVGGQKFIPDSIADFMDDLVGSEVFKKYSKHMKKCYLAKRGQLDLVTTAIVDGESKEVEFELNTGRKGSKSGLTLTFPHFDHSLAYDPTVGVDVGANASGVGRSNGPSMALTALAVATMGTLASLVM